MITRLRTPTGLGMEGCQSPVAVQTEGQEGQESLAVLTGLKTGTPSCPVAKSGGRDATLLAHCVALEIVVCIPSRCMKGWHISCMMIAVNYI